MSDGLIAEEPSGQARRLLERFDKDREFYYHKHYLLLISVLLRAYWQRATIVLPEAADEGALVGGRSSRAPRRLFRCCEVIESANPTLFEGKLSLLCRHSAVGDDIKYDGRVVTQILACWRDAEYQRWSAAQWREVSQGLAIQLKDARTDQASEQVAAILQRIVPDGPCLLLGELLAELSTAAKLAEGLKGKSDLYGCDASGHRVKRTAAELVAWIGGCPRVPIPIGMADGGFSSTIVIISSGRCERQSNSELHQATALVKQALDSITGSGVVLAIVPDILLIGERPANEFRRWLIDNDLLDAVIALPANLKIRTAAAESLLIVRSVKRADHASLVQFVDASFRRAGGNAIEAKWIDLLHATIIERRVDAPNASGQLYSNLVGTREIANENEYSLDFANYLKLTPAPIKTSMAAPSWLAERHDKRNALEARLGNLLGVLQRT